MAIEIGGKMYVTVAERLQAVHAENVRFEVVTSEPYEIAGRVMWRVVVLVDELKYTGNAEVHMNATRGIDKTSPFENAETSALGRALGFAGYGVVESVATADEVIIAKAKAEAQDYDAAVKRASNPPAPESRPGASTPARQAPENGYMRMFNTGVQRGLWQSLPQFNAWIEEVLQVKLQPGMKFTKEQLEMLEYHFEGKLVAVAA